MAISDTLNEGETGYLTVSCFGLTGILETPSTFEYSVVDVASGSVLKDWTEIVSPSSAQLITLEADLQAFVGENAVETRKVTVKVTFGDGGVKYSQFEYTVKELGGVP